MNSAISTALMSYVTSSEFQTYRDEVAEELGKKAVAAAVYTKEEANAAFVSSVNYVAYSEEEKSKLANIADNAQVNVLESVKVKVSDANTETLSIEDKTVVIDLSAYAKSENIAVKSVAIGSSPVGLNLTDGVLSVSADVYSKNDINTILSGKLSSEASVNGKAFENNAVVVNASDLNLGAVIAREVQGVSENVYTTDDTVQGVIADLSARIDNINATVEGQITGVASVTAGSGIHVSGESNPIVSVKVAGKTLSATTDGLSVKLASGSPLAATENGLDLVWSELS